MSDIVDDTTTDASALLREQVEERQGPPDGTVVRFEYVYNRRDYDQHIERTGSAAGYTTYEYLAIWIEEQEAWYLTGKDDNLARTQTNETFMKNLASRRTLRAESASGWTQFKP